MIWPEHHRRDEDRIQSEPWPFAWTVPAAAFRGQVFTLLWPHPHSTQVARRAQEFHDRRAQRAYAAQAALYMDQAAGRVYRPGRSGATPDLVIFDEIDTCPGYGTRFQQLAEALGMEHRDSEEFRRHFLGGCADGA